VTKPIHHQKAPKALSDGKEKWVGNKNHKMAPKDMWDKDDGANSPMTFEQVCGYVGDM